MCQLDLFDTVPDLPGMPGYRSDRHVLALRVAFEYCGYNPISHARQRSAYKYLTKVNCSCCSRCFKCFGEPVWKPSTPMTSWPSARRKSTRFDPRKPAACENQWARNWPYGEWYCLLRWRGSSISIVVSESCCTLDIQWEVFYCECWFCVKSPNCGCSWKSEGHWRGTCRVTWDPLWLPGGKSRGRSVARSIDLFSNYLIRE